MDFTLDCLLVGKGHDVLGESQSGENESTLSDIV